MKIQLDQNGHTIESISDMSRPKGILLSRKGKKMQVDIGNRVSPHALFAALSHLRSVTCAVYLLSKKPALSTLMPIGVQLTASEACFHLGKLLLQQIENRHDVYHTKELSLLTQDTITSLPVELQGLCNLRMHRMETAAALSMLDEQAVANTSFIMPSSEMSYSDYGYRVRKLPQMMVWPPDEPHLPLAFSQILTSQHAPWYNSLCHIALCVRRPLIQRAQMKLTLYEEPTALISAETASQHALPSPIWYDVTRILYPLAASSEKPTNFRLLICSVIDETTKNIL